MLKNKFIILGATALLVFTTNLGAASSPLANLEEGPAVEYGLFSLPFKIAGKVAGTVAKKTVGAAVKKGAQEVVMAPVTKTKAEIRAAKHAIRLAKKAKRTAEIIHEKTDGKDKNGEYVNKDKHPDKEQLKKQPKDDHQENKPIPVIGAPQAPTTPEIDKPQAPTAPEINKPQAPTAPEVQPKEEVVVNNPNPGFREAANRYKKQQEDARIAADKAAQQQAELAKLKEQESKETSSFRKAAARYKVEQQAKVAE